MSAKIRLKRMGAKRKPHSRIVVMDSKAPRDGRVIEEIGFYDPSKEPALLSVKQERAEYWLSVGAEPTEAVKSLLKKLGIKKPVAEKSA